MALRRLCAVAGKVPDVYAEVMVVQVGAASPFRAVTAWFLQAPTPDAANVEAANTAGVAPLLFGYLPAPAADKSDPVPPCAAVTGRDRLAIPEKWSGESQT
jgi:hypothetical protein